MATGSSPLAWRIPWTEEPGGLHSMGSLGVRHDWATSLSLFTFVPWRRKRQPTQCSCLETPRDGGAWWAAVYGVAQTRTRLKRLSSSSSCWAWDSRDQLARSRDSGLTRETRRLYKVTDPQGEAWLPFWFSKDRVGEEVSLCLLPSSAYRGGKYWPHGSADRGVVWGSPLHLHRTGRVFPRVDHPHGRGGSQASDHPLYISLSMSQHK